MAGMKTTDHVIGDRVSVRSREAWVGGRVIARDARRYVVQLDDNRRVVAYEDDLRRWTLAFEVVEMLERMAS